MIIQCEKCKTRFKLDDSRVTASGVRVRCSRCSHTFVVLREDPEEESDFESILQGLGGNEPSGQDEEADLSLGEDSSDKTLEETASLQSEAFAEGELSDESLADRDISLDSLSLPEDEPELKTTSDEQTFSDLLKKGGGLPQFQVPSDFDPSGKVPAAKDDGGSSAPSIQVDNSSAQNSHLVDADADDSVSANSIDANDGPLEPPLLEESEQPRSIREHVWPAADSKEEEGMDDDISPLSISSRRKGSPYFSILMGILLVLLLGGAGFSLFTAGNGGLADFLPDSVRAMFGLGTKTGGLVEIRSLEGAFLANREAGEIFVIKGDAFNVSAKPLTTIQVKGKVFGPNGEVLVQQTVFCGNVISGEQLALQPYSSMVKVMGNQFGETLANFQVLPGKGIPFVIVFRDVPGHAKDFGAEVVSPISTNDR